jgi:hypothetical protein
MSTNAGTSVGTTLAGGGALAFTGFETLAMVVVGLSLLALGAMFLRSSILARRVRSAVSSEEPRVD